MRYKTSPGKVNEVAVEISRPLLSPRLLKQGLTFYSIFPTEVYAALRLLMDVAFSVAAEVFGFPSLGWRLDSGELDCINVLDTHTQRSSL